VEEGEGAGAELGFPRLTDRKLNRIG
jgi:hypothetical protein